MARQPRGLIARAALGLVIAIGAGLGSPARSDAQDAVVGTPISLPFASLPQDTDPTDPYRRLFAELRDRAIREVGSVPGFEPLVASSSVGPRGEMKLIGAVTPRRGVFFMTSAGPYPPSANEPVPASTHMQVCRIEIEWESLPGGASAQSMNWAAMHFPGLDCAPAPENISKLQQWRLASSAASYDALADGADGELRAWLVHETLPDGSSYRPLDIAQGVALVLEPGDAVARTVPALAFGWNAAVVITHRNQIITALPEEPFDNRPDRMCMVTGLPWSMIAQGYSDQIRRAQELCRSLARAENEREWASRPPPRIEVQILETRDGPF